MREGLKAGFTVLKLHRVMANYRPENLRSERLLARLGFEKEGLARSYLKINGSWADHVLRRRPIRVMLVKDLPPSPQLSPPHEKSSPAQYQSPALAHKHPESSDGESVSDWRGHRCLRFRRAILQPVHA